MATTGLLKLPTMQDMNASFMANNPQFGNSQTGAAPAAPKPGMSSYVPPSPTQMGTQTKSPQDNIAPPKNTTNQPKVSAPTTATGTVGTGSTGTADTAAADNGLIGDKSSLNPNNAYFKTFGSLYDLGKNESPEVKAARDELQRYQNSYANASAGVGLGGTDFNYAQGTEQNISNQYQQGLSSRQTALANALSGQGQKISALGGAGNIASPRQNGYALLSPFNNAPVGSGTGGGGNLNSLAYWGGGIDASGALGGANVGNKVSVQNARTNAQSFIPAAHADPNFNVSPVSAINGLAQAWANNTSNTITPGLQAQFNNILNQYVQVLGGKDIVTNIIKSGNATSVEALLHSLDQQANTAINTNASIGSGAGVTAAPPPTTPAAPVTTSTGGQVHEGDTHSFNGVNYKNVGGNWVKQ